MTWRTTSILNPPLRSLPNQRNLRLWRNVIPNFFSDCSLIAIISQYTLYLPDGSTVKPGLKWILDVTCLRWKTFTVRESGVPSIEASRTCASRNLRATKKISEPCCSVIDRFHCTSFVWYIYQSFLNLTYSDVARMMAFWAFTQGSVSSFRRLGEYSCLHFHGYWTFFSWLLKWS
jgi:hypothetical protein